VPALLLLLPENPSKEHVFEFGCTTLAKIKLTGDVNCLLVNLNGEPVVARAEYESIQLTCKQERGKQNSTLFLLSLVAETERVMTGGHLGSSLNGNAAEESGLASEDALEKFEAGGKAIPISFVLEEE